MKFLIYYFFDKIIWVINLFEKEDEERHLKYRAEMKDILLYDESDIASNNKFKQVWLKILNENLDIRFENVQFIYSLHSIREYESLIEKIRYNIRNSFWSIISSYEVYTDNWTTEEFINHPFISLKLVELKDNDFAILVIVKGTQERVEFIDSFKFKKNVIQRFKKRIKIYGNGDFSGM